MDSGNQDQKSTADSQRRADSLYERLGQPHLRPAWELLQRVKLQRGERILEFPSGHGEISCWIAGVVGEQGTVHAADISRAALQATRQSLDLAGHAHAQVVQANPAAIERLGSFDVVFCHAAGPVVEKVEEFLRGIRINLRPGGRFALQIPAAGWCPDFVETVDECLDQGSKGFYAQHFLEPTSQQLTDALKAQGFREFDVSGKLFIERFDTLGDAVAHFELTSLPALLRELPPDARAPFLDTFRRRLAERFRRTQDLEIVFRRTFAYGRR
jgi:trans-aconitate methyltransferase